jgi:hypothetical protein
MDGNIQTTYKVTCCLNGCTNTGKLVDVRQTISPAIAVDFIAIIKDNGWELTKNGWKCPFHVAVDERQVVMPI